MRGYTRNKWVDITVIVNISAKAIRTADESNFMGRLIQDKQLSSLPIIFIFRRSQLMSNMPTWMGIIKKAVYTRNYAADNWCVSCPVICECECVRAWRYYLRDYDNSKHRRRTRPLFLPGHGASLMRHQFMGSTLCSFYGRTKKRLKTAPGHSFAVLVI